MPRVGTPQLPVEALGRPAHGCAFPGCNSRVDSRAKRSTARTAVVFSEAECAALGVCAGTEGRLCDRHAKLSTACVCCGHVQALWPARLGGRDKTLAGSAITDTTCILLHEWAPFLRNPHMKWRGLPREMICRTCATRCATAHLSVAERKTAVARGRTSVVLMDRALWVGGGMSARETTPEALLQCHSGSRWYALGRIVAEKGRGSTKRRTFVMIRCACMIPLPRYYVCMLLAAHTFACTLQG